ncbi:MAG: preprotein translocase subunit YajC [Pirellulales bacterium]
MPHPLPSFDPAPAVSAAVSSMALLAQAEPAGAQQPPELVRTLVNTLPIALVLLAAYMLLFRPEKEKQRRQQELLAGLKKNDRVVTTSGIYGSVASVDRDSDRVTLKIDDAANVKLTVTLGSIARVLGDAESSRTTRDDP